MTDSSISAAAELEDGRSHAITWPDSIMTPSQPLTKQS
jgi:hypothetical protein